MMQVDPQNSANLASIVLSTITSSALVVWIMQMLKKSRWFKWVEEGRPVMNRCTAAVGALAGHLGITFTWNAANHSLGIEGLYFATILHFIWQWANQYALQEIIYQTAVNKPTGPSLAQETMLEAKGAQVVAVSPVLGAFTQPGAPIQPKGKL